MAIFKKALLILILKSIALNAVAQIYNTEAIHIPAGTNLYISGDLNNGGGNIYNAGSTYVTGNFTNNGFINSAPGSYVLLEGAFQYIGGINITQFSNLVIDGTNNKRCLIDEYISENLQFSNNHIIIGNNNLVLLPNATVSGYEGNKFVVTDSTGSLIKKSSPLNTDFVFPVGDTLNSFKPVVLNYSGTIDTFAVRVEHGVVPTTGADDKCVQYTYIVEENNTGGSNASLALGWYTHDEGLSFNRDYTFMWQHRNSWQLIPGIPGAEVNFPLTEWYYKADNITDFSSSAKRFILWENSKPDIFIPNIFSPNNDGNNDVLYVRGQGIKELEFVIYDRWGEKIFESTDMTYGWDGTFKNKVLSTAVFTYYVKAIGYGGDAIEKKGNVTLVR